MKRLRAIYGTLLLLAGLNSTVNAADQVPGTAAKPESYFYTGKPYDADLGAYVYAERDYNPAIDRWTSPDRSGFPDGANNQIYAPVPTDQFDPEGLMTMIYNGFGVTTYNYGQGYAEGTMPGTVNYGNYAAGAIGSADGVSNDQDIPGTGGVTISAFMNGHSWLESGYAPVNLTVGIFYNPNGTLSYSLSSNSYSYTDGIAGAAIDCTITGQNSNEIAVAVNLQFDLDATHVTSVSGGTTSAGVSWTNGLQPVSVALGSFVFYE